MFSHGWAVQSASVRAEVDAIRFVAFMLTKRADSNPASWCSQRPLSVLPQLRALDKKANKVEKVKAKKDGEHDCLCSAELLRTQHRCESVSPG